MSDSMSRSYAKPLKLLAGTAAAALLIGWAAGVGAQTTAEPLPQQQASLPPLPLGQNDVREVQNQLIALGFDPGPADGQAGPATVAGAQQYDQNRGGSGRVSIDGALLARLKADTGPRLSYEQVEARSHAGQQTRASAGAPASNPASNQVGNVVQQIAPLLGALINNSNNNNNNGYGPGYYGPGPGYGPPPGYYRGNGYGGF